MSFFCGGIVQIFHWWCQFNRSLWIVYNGKKDKCIYKILLTIYLYQNKMLTVCIVWKWEYRRMIRKVLVCFCLM